jgi:hypothetical protein
VEGGSDNDPFFFNVRREDGICLVIEPPRKSLEILFEITMMGFSSISS